VLFVVYYMARFSRFSTARSSGLSWSYGLLPTLIFSLRFDESGIAPVALSMLIITFSTVNHVWLGDWAYQCYLNKLKRKYTAERRAATAKHRREQL